MLRREAQPRPFGARTIGSPWSTRPPYPAANGSGCGAADAPDSQARTELLCYHKAPSRPDGARSDVAIAVIAFTQTGRRTIAFGRLEVEVGGAAVRALSVVAGDVSQYVILVGVIILPVWLGKVYAPIGGS